MDISHRHLLTPAPPLVALVLGTSDKTEMVVAAAAAAVVVVGRTEGCTVAHCSGPAVPTSPRAGALVGARGGGARRARQACALLTA